MGDGASVHQGILFCIMRISDAGIDPNRLLTDGVDLLNSVAAVAGVTFGLHLCRCNNRGYYIGEGGYGALARDVFGRANNFKLILLEYDDWRSGSFEPRCEMPQDRAVVLGLVSTKRTELEPSESLIARIEQAGRYYPGEQLALSTRCAFGTVWEGNPISQETQAAKLRLVGEVAHRVWPEGEKSI